MTYQRGWASMSTVSGGVAGDSNPVEITFATGPAHALETGSHVAACDPSIHIVESTIREGWPPSLGDVCPACQAIGENSV